MKAQGLPITVIIVAALGLLVLIIIAAIFSGQVGKFGRVASECPGTCVGSDQADAVGGNTANLLKLRSTGNECPSLTSEISGLYINKGQTGVEPKDLRYCVRCCVSVG